MSYALSAPLQAALYERLTQDPNVTALVGSDVYDATPPGVPPVTYISIGPEEVRDASTKSGFGTEHDAVVSIVTDMAGFAAAKTIAGHVTTALTAAPLVPASGHVVGVWFLKAKAARTDAATTRRIDLTFRIRVDEI